VRMFRAVFHCLKGKSKLRINFRSPRGNAAKKGN
jgi:hypothetical protein